MTTEEPDRAAEPPAASEEAAAPAPSEEAAGPAPSEQTATPEPTAEAPSAEVVPTEAAPPAPSAELVHAAPGPADEPVLPPRRRLLLAVLLPITSVVAAVLVALNISRVFLAGPGAPAVIVATTLTVLILGGAAWISSAGHLRTSSLALGVSLALLIVLSAGLVTFGAGEEDEEAEGPAAPTGPAVASFEVDALPSLAFQSDSFTTSAGINEITYVNRGGTHTLVFTDPALSYFELVVPPSPDKGKVELTAGEEYVMYCSIAGHREAGMEATLTVTEAAAPAEGGGTTDTTTAGPGAPNGETGTPPERAPAEGGETQTETEPTPPGGDAGTGG